MATDDFYESLNDDNEIAFVQVVERLDQELADKLARLGENADERFVHLEFMHEVVGAASALNIDEIRRLDLPSQQNVFDTYSDFAMDVKRYVMAVRLRNIRTGKIYSVELDSASKERIHNLLKKVRIVIERADLDEKKRNSLFNKLNAFEADVDRRRTPFQNAMLAAMDVAHVVKTYGEALNPLNEMFKRISEILGAAKDKEPEQQQLPPPKRHEKLEPPPKQIEGPRQKPVRDDDDIPF